MSYARHSDSTVVSVAYIILRYSNRLNFLLIFHFNLLYYSSFRLNLVNEFLNKKNCYFLYNIYLN